MNTFSANISDLISNSFFIKDGLTGDYAKLKINETIKWLNGLLRAKFENKKIKYSEIERDERKSLINIIDDPLIKTKLSDMYFNIFSKEVEEMEIIDRLLIEKNRIEKEIKRLKDERSGESKM